MNTNPNTITRISQIKNTGLNASDQLNQPLTACGSKVKSVDKLSTSTHDVKQDSLYLETHRDGLIYKTSDFKFI